MKINRNGVDYLITYEERPKDDSEYCPIDFVIRDDEDDTAEAYVWGETVNDIEYKCHHTNVEYGDDDEMGVCPVCGSVCYWRWEDDGEGHKERVPYEWEKDEDEWEKSIIKEVLDNYGKVCEVL